jgi:predicted Fe-S protein YdhL (DUF1289 family)
MAASIPTATTTASAQKGVASPCINVCQMNADTGLCEGCLRTLDEIADWAIYDDDEKRAVRAQLPGRRQALGKP